MTRSKALPALAATGFIAALGGASLGLAAAAETLTRLRAQAALIEAGHDWAVLEVDGLRLSLRGDAPSPLAANAAAAVVEAAAPLAMLDASRLARPPRPGPSPTEPDAPDAQSPSEAADAAAEVAASPAGAGEGEVDGDAAGVAESSAPLRDVQDYPPPPGELDAPLVLAYAPGRLDLAGPAHPSLVEALREAAAGLDAPAEVADGTLPRGPEDVSGRLALARSALAAMALAREARAEIRRSLLDFHAVVEDEATGERLEALLRNAVPPSTALLIRVSSPPPVFSPFRFVVGLGEAGLTVLGCDMPSTEARRGVLAAMEPLGGPQGAAGSAACRVGVGAPSAAWREAAEAGVQALGAVGYGRFELVDMEARLVALPPSDATRLEEAGKALSAALPAGFSLRTFGPPAGPALPRRGGAAEGEVEWFSVRRGADGAVGLSGAAPDAASLTAAEAYAGAKLGGSALTSTLEEAEAAPPPTWRRASLAAVDALEPLDEGEARFDGAVLSVEGRSEDPAAAARVDAALAPLRDAGAQTRSAVTVDVPALAARLPLPPGSCLQALSLQVEASPITFAPGSVELDQTSDGTLDALAGILRRCAGIEVEIQGHTDSQGRESTNEALSQARANAVLDALFGRGAPLAKLTARGYGEAVPIAPNDTEEGRARNRRIAFAATPGGPGTETER